MSKEDEELNRVNLFLHAENVRVFSNSRERHLPVTIVTGFLGVGKTTLLNHILSNKSNLRIAAAINDFAELNIDEKLVASKQTASRLVELSNGCVCCHLLEDLQAAVWKLLQNDVNVDAVNYLVVETSGVSDPLQIIRTLDAKFGTCFRARLDSVVTVVDADQFLHTTTPSVSAIAQLKCADVVILNKIDLLTTKEECDLVVEKIKATNTDAAIYKTRHCKVPLSAILDVDIPPSQGGNVITHEKSSVPIYVSATGGALRCPSSNVVSKSAAATHHHHTHHLKADEFVSTSESIREGPLSLSKLQQFVCSPMVRRLARMKGVLWIQGLEEYRCVIHMSGRGRLGFELDGKWTGPPISEMAFIGRNSMLDAELLTLEFQQCCSSNITTEMNFNDDRLNVLQQRKEFVIFDNDSPQSSLHFFRLTGSEVYGYSEEEIERHLRIDTNAMNKELANAVNASVDDPKAFLAYTENSTGKVMLCYTGGEPANNAGVLFREAAEVLSTHFRNVSVCKCRQ